MVAATVARALDLSESVGKSAREQLLDHLCEQPALLVLDNFEHVLEARALLAELLQHCPRLRLLATSRIALRLRAEHRFVVDPLVTPGEQAPSVEAISATSAVRLFVERVGSATPDFRLDDSNAHAVAAICRRLDGMPLAIELAAARVGVLQPEALLRRLDRRLPLLTDGAADLPERQQTLRRTLAWSYDLLGPADKATVLRP